MASMDKIALLELIRKIGLEDGDIDFLREGLKVLAEAVMDAEVSQLIGAERFERSTERKNYRNGYRRREWDTRVGTIELQIPKLRKGSYFPGLLEPRRRAEKALLNVVQEAYVHGVSTRKVDELVESLGIGGISKSEVSRICKELDRLSMRLRVAHLKVSSAMFGWMPPSLRSVKVVGFRVWRSS